MNRLSTASLSQKSSRFDLNDPALESSAITGRVLIVDDSPMTLRQVRYFLEKDGLEVFEAKSGEEAVWLVGEVEPDLILMDVMMEGMNGMDSCRQIKANPNFSEIPVIFLTGLGERRDIVNGFKAGGVDYITKPFHPAEGLSRIHTHLRMRQLAQFRKQNIEQLEQLNHAKDRLLRVASHDLRNPLAAIIGLSEFLQDGLEGLKPRQQEVVGTILTAANGMHRLLNDLLDLSKLEAGNMEIKAERLNLSALTLQIVEQQRLKATEKNITIHLNQDGPAKCVHADPVQICRVLDNLLSNAIKYSPRGRDIWLKMEVLADLSVTWTVEDNGLGIHPEDESKLFQEFGKTRNLPTGGESSTGLGLSICQRILEAHGGNIEYTPRNGGGSRFTVSFAAE